MSISTASGITHKNLFAGNVSLHSSETLNYYGVRRRSRRMKNHPRICIVTAAERRPAGTVAGSPEPGVNRPAQESRATPVLLPLAKVEAVLFTPKGQVRGARGEGLPGHLHLIPK